MTPERQQGTYISIRTAVRRSGLSEEIVHECVMRQIVADPLTDDDLRELRRVRRLQELGVNLQGIEVIMHMRQQIQALRAEMDRMQHLFGSPTFGSPSWEEIDAEWRRLPPGREEYGSER
ncbi:MAG TPA: hypothetical protein VLC95_15985 [Anaerolineae bacterium]|nr:hypothetical protein [Anaerolineae bacterium]